MMSQPFSLLLITADSQVFETVAETLRAEPTLMLLKAATFVEAIADSTTLAPDLILLDMAEGEGDGLITAVSTHFPHATLILLTDTDDKSDSLPRDQLTAPLLSRLLVSIHQTHHHTLLQNQAREQRQTSEALLQTSIQLNAILDYELLLDSILERAAEFLPYDLATILLIQGDQVHIERVRAVNGVEALEWAIARAAHVVFTFQETRNLREMRANGRYMVIPNVDDYPDWIHLRGSARIRSWVGAPLIVQGDIIGFLTLDKADPNFYQEEHGLILETFAKQAAQALRNALIYQGRQREIAELSALQAIAQASTEAVTVDELLTRCTQIVAEKLYPDSFGFILVNNDGTMSAHHAIHNRLPVLHPDKLPLGTGVVGQVILTGKLRRVSDVRSDQEYKEIVAHTHSELCVPLQVRDQIIGAINAESILYEAFTEADERFLVTLSQQLSTAIERIRLIQAERSRHQEAAVLRQATHSLTASLDLEQVLTNILNRLEEVVPYESASVMLLHEENLVIAASRGFGRVSNIVGQTFPATNTLFAEVLQLKRPLCLPDAQENPHFDNRDHAYKIRGWICLPLIVHEQILGLLTVDHTEVGAYGDIETRLAQSFANYAAIAIENARLYSAEQQARKTAEIMREANAMLAQSLDLDIILKTLLEYMQGMAPFDHVTVWFIQEDFAQIYFPQRVKEWLQDETLIDMRVNIKADPLFQEMFVTQRGLLIADVQKDIRWSTFAATPPAQSQTRSWMGIPIIAGGEFLGLFSIENAKQDFFTKQQLQAVADLISQSAMLIQNAQLLRETRQRTAELETIATLSASLRETVDVEALLRIILENALQLLDGSYGGIYLIEPDTGDLVLRSTRPYIPELIGATQSVNEGISGYVVRTGQIYIVPDIRKEPLLMMVPGEASLLEELRTSINMPLRAQERIVGVLHVNLNRPHTFADMELKLLTAVSEIAGTAIDRAMVLDTLEHRVALRTRELAKANERLTELDRLKTKFVSDISHELRTPITNLSLYLDLLEKGNPERQQQYTAVLRRQVDRLITMIEDILSISRLDMGKIKLNVTTLDVNKVVQQVVAAFVAHMDETIVLSAAYQPDMPQIIGDEKQIAQMLTNLLNNAVSYTPNGAIHVTTWWTTTWHDDQKRVCMSVADTGMGIPPLEVSHVFERFYRASNVSQSTMPGTGLGLSLVKELVDMHHGDIEITSELNKGTTITLALPLSALT